MKVFPCLLVFLRINTVASPSHHLMFWLFYLLMIRSSWIWRPLFILMVFTGLGTSPSATLSLPCPLLFPSTRFSWAFVTKDTWSTNPKETEPSCLLLRHPPHHHPVISFLLFQCQTVPAPCVCCRVNVYSLLCFSKGCFLLLWAGREIRDFLIFWRFPPSVHRSTHPPIHPSLKEDESIKSKARRVVLLLPGVAQSCFQPLMS